MNRFTLRYHHQCNFTQTLARTVSRTVQGVLIALNAFKAFASYFAAHVAARGSGRLIPVRAVCYADSAWPARAQRDTKLKYTLKQCV